MKIVMKVKRRKNKKEIRKGGKEEKTIKLEKKCKMTGGPYSQ